MAVKTFLFIVDQLFYTFIAPLELSTMAAVFYTTSRASPTAAENDPSVGQTSGKVPSRVDQHILRHNASTTTQTGCVLPVFLASCSRKLEIFLQFGLVSSSVFLGHFEKNSRCSRHTKPVEDNYTGNNKSGSETSYTGNNNSYKPGCVMMTLAEEKQPKVQWGWSLSFIAHVDWYVVRVFLEDKTLFFLFSKHIWKICFYNLREISTVC